jgi:hypothetical protein
MTEFGNFTENSKWADYLFRDLDNLKLLIDQEIEQREKVIESLKGYQQKIRNSRRTIKQVLELELKIYREISLQQDKIATLQGYKPLDITTAIAIVQTAGFRIFR